MYRKILIWGALFGGLSVVIGAFGAHGLKPIFSLEQMNSFETGVKYQFYHSLAMIMAGIIYGFHQQASIRWAGWSFLLGIILFSGSLYLLSYLGATSSVGLGGLGIITPIGGLFFILGWFLIILGLMAKTPTRP